MPVAKVIELISRSDVSFEDAIQKALEDAKKSIRNIRKVKVMDLEAIIENDILVAYQVTVKVTFEIERE